MSAARRIHDTEYPYSREWIVGLEGDSNFMTVISNDGVDKMSDSEIKDMIMDCWMPEWDDIRKINALGDYRLGSSDFQPRERE